MSRPNYIIRLIIILVAATLISFLANAVLPPQAGTRQLKLFG